MGYNTSQRAGSSLDLHFFTQYSIHACIMRLREECNQHRHIRVAAMLSDLVQGAVVITLVYERDQRITGLYSCLLRSWDTSETLVQGPADANLHRDRQSMFPSWTAVLLGGLSWLILLGTALLLHHAAYQALAFAGFALFTGLAFLMMAVMSKPESVMSSDTYLLRDLLKATLTSKMPRPDLAPTIPSASGLRQKRRPAHITGRSPLATDKHRGHFPPPGNQQPPMPQ